MKDLAPRYTFVKAFTGLSPQRLGDWGDCLGGALRSSENRTGGVEIQPYYVERRLSHKRIGKGAVTGIAAVFKANNPLYIMSSADRDRSDGATRSQSD